MKYIILICTFLFLGSAMADTVEKPAEPKTKRVCVNAKDRNGNEIKNSDGSTRRECRTIRVHKKHEGTKVPTDNKK